MGDLDIHQRTSSGTPFKFAACLNAGRAILPAAAFLGGFFRHARVFLHGKRRLKAGGSQDWPPH
jgi:hypothetical protein